MKSTPEIYKPDSGKNPRIINLPESGIEELTVFGT